MAMRRRGRPLKFGRPGQSITLTDGRAFIALEAGGGVADLELAVIDRLDARGVSVVERTQLPEFRQIIRDWRKQGLKFHSRSILVVERQSVAQPVQPLSKLATTG